MGKNCARGLEYGPRPQAEGRAHFENYFIRNICVDFFTEAVSHRARAFDVSVKQTRVVY